ncbi:hypothetical protein NDU88_006791 [Pleurodeles waltl]|uniref:Uncharacterized protein n=1 Tax=Pleurodeles waltl TaxID=8319 RepID=A0AAV7QL15_PLEWA|nr:hypothetical protein NDU88_006791 [Pleurodeles waltl]
MRVSRTLVTSTVFTIIFEYFLYKQDYLLPRPHNMASFDDNRDTLAAELFSRKPQAPRTSDHTPTKEGLRQKFIKLERLRKQELARWWDITTLKRYLELKQIPRGLRVIIFPSFEDLDPDLLGEWEHLISATSFGMINILIKHADRKRDKLLQDITSLEEEIKNLNLTEATDKNYTIMREILTGYQLYIKDKKMRKLIRDDNDYTNGRSYTFARRVSRTLVTSTVFTIIFEYFLYKQDYLLPRPHNMASFDDNRDTLAAELFSRKPQAPRTSDQTPTKEGLRQKFIKLERLRKQELARWWDITTLKRYLELKQIPRGLRVIIFPSFEDLDPDLLGEWEHLISATSFGMINILIKHADRKRDKLLQDITSLEEEIKNLNLTEATDKNYTIMREILTGYQLYIKDKKMRKLIRDDNDYTNGRSYTFARRVSRTLVTSTVFTIIFEYFLYKQDYLLPRPHNMASFDDNRDTLAAELFSRKPQAPRTSDHTPTKEGLRQKFIKLERLRKQELARWWDITTLKRYLELKQIPRGLRVIIFPSFEDLDPDLLGEWEHLISATSFGMINILIKHADRKRDKLLQDITSLEEEIKNLNLTEATDKNYTIMREILTGYQLYIKDKKMRKLIRDDNDYTNGRSYTFARRVSRTLVTSTVFTIIFEYFLYKQDYLLPRPHNMASFDDNRDTLAAELFSRKPQAPRTSDHTPTKEGLRQKFIKLERLRKQELARWWDITTLKRYLELKQIPRGLRVIIFPSFEDLDPDLLGEWEHLISATSFGMINILIKHADRKRDKLLQDITSLEEEIKNLNLTEATDKNYTIMREILTGYQLYIKDKKMRKLIRDDNDYTNGRIYTFARRYAVYYSRFRLLPLNRIVSLT